MHKGSDGCVGCATNNIQQRNAISCYERHRHLGVELMPTVASQSEGLLCGSATRCGGCTNISALYDTKSGPRTQRPRNTGHAAEHCLCPGDSAGTHHAATDHGNRQPKLCPRKGVIVAGVVEEAVVRGRHSKPTEHCCCGDCRELVRKLLPTDSGRGFSIRPLFGKSRLSKAPGV